MDLEQFDEHMALEERARRDADPGAFWMDLLFRNSPDATRIQDRDQNVVRMLNTWKDVWSGNKHNIAQSPLSLALSDAYARFSVLLLLIGVAPYVLRLRRWSLWDRFGTICILITCMEIASLIAYTYRYPHPPGVPNKGVYIAPALLGLGYLMTLMLQSAGELRRPQTPMRRFFCYSLLSLLVVMTLMNAGLPVY